MPFPFEVGFDEVQSNLEACVGAVFGCLESQFLVMPKGGGFVENVHQLVEHTRLTEFRSR